MYEQRKVFQESFDLRDEEKYWFPKVDRDGKKSVETEMGLKNWYAVIDDIAEGIVVMQIASWPKLDQGNHLRFDEIYVQDFPLDLMQQLINKVRYQHKQPANNRLLRTGDAFSIESVDRPGENLLRSDFDGVILDITASAREQAKIALYSAVTRKLTPGEINNENTISGILDGLKGTDKSQESQDSLGSLPTNFAEEI